MQDAEDGIGHTEEGDWEEDLEEGGKIEGLLRGGGRVRRQDGGTTAG